MGQHSNSEIRKMLGNLSEKDAKMEAKRLCKIPFGTKLKPQKKKEKTTEKLEF